MNNPPQKKKNITENKKKTEGTGKAARTNHTFATKKVHEEKHEHKDTTCKKHHHQKNLPRDKQKKTLFFPGFWPPRKSGTNFEDNFSAANKTQKQKKKKNGPLIENAKIGKRYFSPDFLMPPKGRVNKRAGGGGGVFLMQLGRRRSFWTLFFGGPISKVECTQTDMILRK